MQIITIGDLYEDQIEELAALHGFIFTYDKVKDEGKVIANAVITAYEFKFNKRFKDFNVMEKAETEKKFMQEMKPVYAKNRCEVV